MATFHEILVKIFCAKRYATKEEEMHARLQGRTHRRPRRRRHGYDISGNSPLSGSMGVGIGLGFGMRGPKNNYGMGLGPGF